MARHSLHAARARPNDEFYTRVQTVENELAHHPDAFRGRTVHLPCDDSQWSSFWRVFGDGFARLGLHQLVATHYSRRGTGGWAIMDEPGEIRRGKLKGNGEFWSPEVQGFMANADIVATNPPFSKIREFVEQCLRHKCDYLILGPLTLVSNAKFLPHLVEGRARVGRSLTNKTEFVSPSGEVKPVNARWFTTLPVERPGPLALSADFEPSRYTRYDDVDALEVPNLKAIPRDYGGNLGVPLTFIDKWCPDQFEIVGRKQGPLLGGDRKFRRLLVRNKTVAPVAPDEPTLPLH